MARAKCYSRTGEPTGREVELPEIVFGAPVSEAAVHAALLAYRMNQSSAQAKAKTRGEVRGGGRKPWRQKGTGHARQGSRTAPHWRGGGAVFGPVGRRMRRKLPKRLRQTASRSARSARASEGGVLVIEALEFDAPKTKPMAEALRKMELEGKRVAVLLAEPRENAQKSLRNLPGVETRVAPAFSTYDLVVADALVVEESALDIIAQTFGRTSRIGGGSAEEADA